MNMKGIVHTDNSDTFRTGVGMAREERLLTIFSSNEIDGPKSQAVPIESTKREYKYNIQACPHLRWPSA
jgi:hypothetical protein